MADSTGLVVTIEGAEELERRLKSVSTDLATKGGRFALRKAAQVIRNAAKEKAEALDDPRTAANIANNIVERWSPRTFKATGNMKFRVGVMGGAGGSARGGDLSALPGGDTRHWRYVEFGTEKTPARSFLRTAMSENVAKATAVFVFEYNKKLDRLLK